MWLDVIAVALLGFFAGMGALRGGLASGMALLSLGVAYASAIVAAPRLGPGLAQQLGAPELLGVPIAGTLAFAVAYLAMGIVSAVLRRIERRRRRGFPRSARDRFVGSVFGAVRGAGIVLLLSWLALWIDALRATGVVEDLPELGSSTAAAMTESVVEAGVSAVLSDAGSGGRLVARMAARPGAALTDLQSAIDNPSIAALRADRLFWTYVEHGSVDAALNRGSFLRISRDAALRQQLADLGLIDEAAAADARVFRAAAADVLREVGPRIRGLKQDPELQELLADPEVVAMVRSGDTMGLVTHSGFRHLVARVASGSDS
jgi:uncharacterized membrane protein required for colicin V production